MTTTDGDVSGSKGPADESYSYRQLIIDLLCLNLTACQRSVAAEEALDKALEALGPVFNVLRIVPNVNRIDITTPELAEQYRVVSSPAIRVDGVDICAQLPESHCDDCSNLSGSPTDCRVLVPEGHDHDQPPAGMIADGILKVLYGQLTATEPAPYSMPANLVNYFDGLTTPR